MLLFIRYFLCAIALFHILSVVLVNGLDIGISTTTLALIRESVLIVFFLITGLIVAKKNHLQIFIKNFWPIISTSIVLLGYSIIFSIAMDKSISDIMIGMKYTFRYIAILLIAIYIGTIVADKEKEDTNETKRGQEEKKIEHFFSRLFSCIVAIVTIGILWQIAKHVVPQFFYAIGYGPVGDFVFGSAPPLYYRTGPGGFPRLSGIFSGPNNYGYFLVLYSTFIVEYIREKKSSNTHKNIFYGLIYLGSALFTLSRGAVVGIVTQIIIVAKNIWKDKNIKYLKTYIIAGSIITIGILVTLFAYKSGSTFEHIDRSLEGIKNIVNHPMGFGLGTAGPAIHHQGTLLPENYYLQLIAEVGIIGFIFRCMWLYSIIIIIRKIFKEKKSENWVKGKKYLYAMLIGIIGLSVEGLFLHVFEDSMVNYLYFIPLGIIIGYLGWKNINS